MQVSLGTFECNHLIRDKVNEVLDSGRLSYGPKSKELEAIIAKQHECTHGILSNSGTSSLLVALEALKETYGWYDWSEVIIPATTFVATANAIIQARLTPVVVDVHSSYYDLDPYLIQPSLTKSTVAVIAVNIFGKPADLQTISIVCGLHNLRMIEDSCEAMWVGISKRSVGSWGDIGVFSFYMAHILTAGVGGMSITNDDALALKMRSLVNHGLSANNLPSSDEYDPSFLGRDFVFDRIGHSFRITELEAAVALGQIDRMAYVINIRQRVARYYNAILDEFSEHMQLPTVRPTSRSSWMMYPIVLRKQKKHGMMDTLRKNGIEVRDMLPLTTQPCYKGQWNPEDYPISNWLNKNGFYIGCHQDTTMEQQHKVRDVMYEYWRSNA